jgi:diguanylate cyclase (GGDEF)-like protein
MARTFGTLFLVGGLVGVVSLIATNPSERNDAVLVAMSGVALVLAIAFFVTYRRTPFWLFQLALASGSVVIAAAAAGGSINAEGGYGVFYVWVVLLAFLFFPFPSAMLQTAFAALTYAVVLIARDSEFAFNFILGVVAVLGAAGAVVGLLRARLEELAVEMSRQAHTDAVTAIANRRSFEERLEIEIERAERFGTELSLVICDLDRFKTVNDELGHDEGDMALRLAASSIAASIRSIDVVARLGGEEFAVLLPNASRREAYEVAERLRLAVREAFADHEVPVTASCGLASVSTGGNFSKAGLMRAADSALYEAKRAGRDRTRAYGEETLVG